MLSGACRAVEGWIWIFNCFKTECCQFAVDIKRSRPSSKYQILRSLWNLVRSSQLKAAVFWCCRCSLHPHTHVKYFPTLKYNYLTFTHDLLSQCLFFCQKISQSTQEGGEFSSVGRYTIQGFPIICCVDIYSVKANNDGKIWKPELCKGCQVHSKLGFNGR